MFEVVAGQVRVRQIDDDEWLRSLQRAAFVCPFGQQSVTSALVDVHEK
ncbi:hypothetical protein [Streptomyces clavifer]